MKATGRSRIGRSLVSVGVDPILPPDTALERFTHRIVVCTQKADSELPLMVGGPEVNAPEVTINHHCRWGALANPGQPAATLAGDRTGVLDSY